MYDWPEAGLNPRGLGHIPKACLNAAYLRSLAQFNCFIRVMFSVAKLLELISNLGCTVLSFC